MGCRGSNVCLNAASFEEINNRLQQVWGQGSIVDLNVAGFEKISNRLPAGVGAVLWTQMQLVWELTTRRNRGSWMLGYTSRELGVMCDKIWELPTVSTLGAPTQKKNSRVPVEQIYPTGLETKDKAHRMYLGRLRHVTSAGHPWVMAGRLVTSAALSTNGNRQSGPQ
ncbi:hypothetical protein K438DRAFT_1768190 [Mycena galopus ATCC 62051]|nr:hypothetical protein K438DRAFT_1768190 [Mycena galopus ATCC 62051]